MALASKILQRVIVTPTATQIRGATLLAGAFADTGLLVPEDISCGDIDASDVTAGTYGGPLLLTANTGLIDFLVAAPQTFAVPFPVLPGRSLVGTIARLAVKTRVGVATGAAGWNVGNNVTFDNLIPAAVGGISAAAINGASAGAGSTLSTNAGINYIDMSTTAPSVRVTLVPTGLSDYKGVLIFTGLFLPTP